MGSGLEDGTTQGPLISAVAVDRVGAADCAACQRAAAGMAWALDGCCWWL